MKYLARLASAQPVLLALVTLLLFGNCAQNVYRVLGPGTTPQQVRQLKQLSTSVYAAYEEARRRPPTAAGAPPTQVLDSAEATRRRLLSPAQYKRWQNNRSVLPLRYPRRPPRHYR